MNTKKIKIDRGKVVTICNWFSLPLQFLGACLVYLIMETFCRHSLFEAVNYMTGSPAVFLYNAFFIFVTTTLVYLTRRRVFARILIYTIWLVLGVINGAVLANRVTPFTGPDLKLLTETVRILNKYLSLGMVILVVILALGLIAGLVYLAIKAPKYQGKMYYKLNIPLVLAAALSFGGVTNLALEKRVLSSYFGNIAFAYLDYGFPYCLATTFFNTGIDCPNGYGEDLMEEIVQSTKQENLTAAPEADTNILFLQLESFFDPSLVEFLNLSEDPIPYFRSLMKEYTSGYFKVPSIGAGTANTEFETITGMSLRYFGPGEYPYKSILKEKTCESIPYVLKGLGYSTHAIHNNEANFYGRRTIFANLGFQSFISEEYMPDISDTTPTDWVKDHILTDEIMKCLESSEGPDYVYTISVQGHGDYPTEPILEEPLITVTGAENREKNNYSWEYYVNQLKEMDDFIKELTAALEEFDEPTVLVMFGDHLPTMGLSAEEVENRYLFQTQYVMWDNFGMEKEDVNLSAYQAGAEVLNRLGIHDGNVVSYHQTRRNTQNYQLDLEALQYDILYGEQYVYQGQEPYQRTKIQLGVVPIEFESIEEIAAGSYYITGSNFTASSKLEINKEVVEDTIFISPSLLLVREVEIKDGDSITIAQQSNSSTHKVLTRTDAMIYDIPEPEPSVTPEATEEIAVEE